MIHRQVFIATHMGSGGSMLMDMILANRKAGRIRREPTQVYADPTTLLLFQRSAAILRPHARVFLDRLTLNHELLNSNFYDLCDYIYLVRDAEGTLNSLVESGKFTPQAALRYYSFRLRRLCELAKKTPRKIVISWDQLVDKSCLPAVKSFLGMKELISMYRPQQCPKLVDPALVAQGQKCYRRHLDYLNRLMQCSLEVK